MSNNENSPIKNNKFSTKNLPLLSIIPSFSPEKISPTKAVKNALLSIIDAEHDVSEINKNRGSTILRAFSGLINANSKDSSLDKTHNNPNHSIPRTDK